MNRSAALAGLLSLLLLAGLAAILLNPGAGVQPPPTKTDPASPVIKQPAVKKPPARPPEKRVSTPQPTAAISGDVLRADGKPAWRATVKLKIGPYVLVRSTLTDRKGQFRFTELNPKNCYSIEASLADCMPERIDNVDPGRHDLRFTLRPGARLSGQVLSGDVGMPLGKFTVVMTGTEERAITFDDADGTFVIEGLAGGPYTIYVSSVGYADSDPWSGVIPKGKSVTQNFTLPPRE